MFKKIVKYIVFTLLLSGVIFLQAFAIKKNEAKKIEKVAIVLQEENQFLTYEMVNKLLIQNQAFVQNQQKSVIDLHSLESKVSNNPYVDKTNIYVTLNGILCVYIAQKETVGRVIEDDSSYYIDKVGVTMPLSTTYTPRVPLITGVIATKKPLKVHHFLNEIKNDAFLNKEIIGVIVSKNEEVILKVRSGDYTIEMGKMDDAATKFRKLKAFYNKAFKDTTIANYKNINLTYTNQVVCTK